VSLLGCQPKEESKRYQIFGDEELIAAQLDGQWGYIDQEGEVVIDFHYDVAYPFHRGYAAVKKGDLYYLIDVNDQYIFEEGYTELQRDGDAYFFVYNERMGIMDFDGTILANPVYDVIMHEDMLDAHYSDDLVRVSVNGKFSFLNRDGDVKISAMEYQEASYFSHGYAKVKKNDLYGMMNTEGFLMIPCTYTELSDFDMNGFSIGKTASNDEEYVLINKDHDVIAQGYMIQKAFNLMYLVAPESMNEEDITIYDQEGILIEQTLTETLIEQILDDLRIPIDDRYFVNFQYNNDEHLTYSIYNEHNVLLFTVGEGDYNGSLNFIYDEKDTLYAIRQVSDWNDFLKEIYLDDGKNIIKVKSDDVKQIFTDMIVAVNDEKYGVVNRSRVEVVPFEYDDLIIFSDGIMAKKDGKSGILSHDGTIMIPFIYENLLPTDLFPPHHKFDPFTFYEFLEE
jgi:hypothetical protein